MSSNQTIIQCAITGGSNGTWLLKSNLLIDGNKELYNLKYNIYQEICEKARLCGMSWLPVSNVEAARYLLANNDTCVVFHYPTFHTDRPNNHLTRESFWAFSTDVLYLIKRIQRLFRIAILKKLRERRLAVYMAFHSRLGQACIIRTLSEDLLMKITNC